MFHDSNLPPSSHTCDHTVAPAASHQPLSKCGICGKQFFLSESASRPFCSRRCQQIDLGRWMNESYGLPWEDSTVPEEEVGLLDDTPDEPI